jgi:hypothetical protein
VNDSKAHKSVNNSKAHKQKKASKATASKGASAQSAAASSASSPQEAGLSYELIRERAYALYVSRGGEHGQDQDDWFRAEQELLER